ncbi:LysR family transcriptional regulator [Echinimonas agarilytica]|uniref:LysR family transcriptional regulator n=1 Tax=Echinimonas agarilytica TaxID=1215918 RepID=A0AA41W4M4_9GAMM|nr:LysR family transcriptional regulator [Echinimonas agarilytica]MCM2678691.1 LysR family transcriptional regulator [Echinimonas agarilytica]
MDVKVFKTFLEVAREKHFGRAAENLYLTQAAVSARIKQLESFFETSLFVRDRNAIRLTSAGERLISYAENMVRTLDQAKSELQLTQAHAVQLTIAGTPNIWDAFLQHWLSVVTDTFNGYAFCAETMNSGLLNRALVERTLDIGMTFDPIKSDDIISEHVSDLELLMVYSSAQLEQDALKNRYVYVDWGTRFASEHAERHAQMAAPFLRTSSGRIALDFILEKGGAAYLPKTMVEPFLEAQQLRTVEGVDEWKRPVYLSYRKNAASLNAILKVQRLINQTEPESAFLLQQASDSNELPSERDA